MTTRTLNTLRVVAGNMAIAQGAIFIGLRNLDAIARRSGSAEADNLKASDRADADIQYANIIDALKTLRALSVQIQDRLDTEAKGGA